MFSIKTKFLKKKASSQIFFVVLIIIDSWCTWTSNQPTQRGFGHKGVIIIKQYHDKNNIDKNRNKIRILYNTVAAAHSKYLLTELTDKKTTTYTYSTSIWLYLTVQCKHLNLLPHQLAPYSLMENTSPHATYLNEWHLRMTRINHVSYKWQLTHHLHGQCYIISQLYLQNFMK